MKKFLIILAILMIALALIACNGGKQSAETTASEATAAETTVTGATADDTTAAEITTVAETAAEVTTVAEATLAETTLEETVADETTVAEETTVEVTTEAETTVAETTAEETVSDHPDMKADILDLGYNEGQFVNLAEGGGEITVHGTAPEYGDGIITFDASKESYLRFEKIADLYDTIGNGYTLEIVVSMQSLDGYFFSNLQAGGFGLGAETGSFAFLNKTTGTGEGYGEIDYRFERNIFYHIVCTYSKDLGKMFMYVNGELVGTAKATGSFVCPDDATGRYFAIGADSAGHWIPDPNLGENFTSCQIKLARIYSHDCSANDAARLYAAVAN